MGSSGDSGVFGCEVGKTGVGRGQAFADGDEESASAFWVGQLEEAGGFNCKVVSSFRNEAYLDGERMIRPSSASQILEAKETSICCW